MRHARCLIQQIDNLKARVEGLGYAKPDVALEYITDYMVDSYKNKDNVVAGSASRSGNTITLANWQHVAAFEVKDASGNSNDATVKVSSGGYVAGDNDQSIKVFVDEIKID